MWCKYFTNFHPSTHTHQTASNWHSGTAHRSVPIFHNGSPLPLSKLPLPMVDLVDLDRWTNLNPEPKLYLFSGFCRAHYCDRPTDSPTDHTTRSVTIGRIYVCRTAMRPNNNTNTHANVLVLVIMTKVIARVHPVHLMNADWAPGECQSSDQADRLRLWVRW